MAGPWERYNQTGRQATVFEDPYRPAEERRSEEDQAMERERLELDRQRAAIAAQQAQVDAAKAPSEIALTQAQAAGATQELVDTAQKRDTKMIQRALQTDSVLEAINMARDQIGEGYSTGNFFGGDFWQGVPGLGQDSANLNATLSGLQGSIINDTISQLKELSASGASGYGSLTETEAQRLAAAVGALQQTQSDDALRTNLARVERHYRNALALLNNEDPREPEVAERYGIIQPADEPEDMGGTGGGQLTSEGRWEPDPALAGVNSTVRDMIQRGRSADDVRSYLNTVQPGLGDRTADLDRAVQRARQNPNEAQSFNIDLEKQWVPASGLSRAMGDIGMSSVGAGLIGAADTASFGLLDNLTDNPAMTRAVMQGVSEENPNAYLLGQIAGGVTTGLGAEAGLARGGLTGLRAARAGDVGYGAAYSAGSADEADDSRVTAALLGGVAGGAGGALGRGVARTAGRAISGVGDASQRALNAAGVRMTPGQILGGGVKRTEDRLAGLPFVGDQITARRLEGIEDFNRAAFNQAAEGLGVAAPDNLGAAGIETLRAGRNQRYGDLLDNQRFVPDEELANDIASILASSSSLPGNLGADVTQSLQGRIGNAVEDAGGMDVISGRSFQRSLRGLDRDVRSLMKDAPVMGDAAEDAIRGGRDALLGLAQRQAPGVAEELARINQGNSLYETLRSSVNAARNQGEQFMPSQLSNAASITARRFGNRQGTTQQPFYELARAGQEVLPSKIPDSGTAGRMILPLAVGATAGGGSYAAQDPEAEARAGSSAGAAAIAALLAAAPYSPAARNTLQRALMAERPVAVANAGEQLIERADIAGLLARAGTTAAIN